MADGRAQHGRARSDHDNRHLPAEEWGPLIARVLARVLECGGRKILFRRRPTPLFAPPRFSRCGLGRRFANDLPTALDDRPLDATLHVGRRAPQSAPARSSATRSSRLQSRRDTTLSEPANGLLRRATSADHAAADGRGRRVAATRVASRDERPLEHDWWRHGIAAHRDALQATDRRVQSQGEASDHAAQASDDDREGRLAARALLR